jgi:Flp pilus assembly protein TadD
MHAKSILWTFLTLAVLMVPLVAPAQEDADMWNERGLILKQEGRYDEAADAFGRALASDPGHLEAMNNLGRVHFVAGRYSEAAALFEKVLRRTPHAVGTKKNLAAAYARMGRYQDAVSVLQSAVASAPGDAQARLELGIVSLLAGDRSTAERQYDALRDMDADSAAKLKKILDRVR